MVVFFISFHFYIFLFGVQPTYFGFTYLAISKWFEFIDRKFHSRWAFFSNDTESRNFHWGSKASDGV